MEINSSIWSTLIGQQTKEPSKEPPKKDPFSLGLTIKDSISPAPTRERPPQTGTNCGGTYGSTCSACTNTSGGGCNEGGTYGSTCKTC